MSLEATKSKKKQKKFFFASDSAPASASEPFLQKRWESYSFEFNFRTKQEFHRDGMFGFKS